MLLSSLILILIVKYTEAVVPKIFVIFAGKHLCWSLFFNIFASFQTCCFTKKRIQHLFSWEYCDILKNTCERLLLNILLTLSSKNLKKRSIIEFLPFFKTFIELYLKLPSVFSVNVWLCKKNSAFYYSFISFFNWYRVFFPNKPKRCPETLPPGKLPPVRVRVWVRIRIRVGGSFPRGQLSYNQPNHACSR